jgi:SHS2 domain-containing protein
VAVYGKSTNGTSAFFTGTNGMVQSCRLADLPSGTLTDERAIEVKGVDAEALLVNWLNELIYHTEMDGEVFGEFRIESFEQTHLRATVRAGRGIELKKQIKAVTFHNLQIVLSGDGYEVTLVFDV